MKVIIDTNVAIDIMAHRDEFIDDSAKVFTFCCSELVEGFFSSSTFSDLHYILHKYIHDENSVRRSMAFWLNMMGILEVNELDCKRAILSKMMDYEDALLAEVDRRHGIDYIVTRNAKIFVNSPVPAVTPHDFIEIAMKYQQ